MNPPIIKVLELDPVLEVSMVNLIINNVNKLVTS